MNDKPQEVVSHPTYSRWVICRTWWSAHGHNLGIRDGIAPAWMKDYDEFDNPSARGWVIGCECRDNEVWRRVYWSFRESHISGIDGISKIPNIPAAWISSGEERRGMSKHYMCMCVCVCIDISWAINLPWISLSLCRGSQKLKISNSIFVVFGRQKTLSLQNWVNWI